MTDPRASGNAGKSSEQLLAEALRARAGQHVRLEFAAPVDRAAFAGLPGVEEVVVEGAGWSIGGMAKGAGMLAPALATMLVVITTDAVVPAADLDTALRAATRVSFDRLDSDGCMSTNDTVLLLASGASGRGPLGPELAVRAGELHEGRRLDHDPASRARGVLDHARVQQLVDLPSGAPEVAHRGEVERAVERGVAHLLGREHAQAHPQAERRVADRARPGLRVVVEPVVDGRPCHDSSSTCAYLPSRARLSASDTG